MVCQGALDFPSRAVCVCVCEFGGVHGCTPYSLCHCELLCFRVSLFKFTLTAVLVITGEQGGTGRVDLEKKVGWITLGQKNRYRMIRLWTEGGKETNVT